MFRNVKRLARARAVLELLRKKEEKGKRTSNMSREADTAQLGAAANPESTHTTASPALPCPGTARTLSVAIARPGESKGSLARLSCAARRYHRRRISASLVRKVPRLAETRSHNAQRFYTIAITIYPVGIYRRWGGEGGGGGRELTDYCSFAVHVGGGGHSRRRARERACLLIYFKYVTTDALSPR